MKRLICLSILSGLLIGLGDIVFIETLETCKPLGAFLFSLGLLGVVVQGGQLYTGRIGYWPIIGTIKGLGIMLLCNLVTIWIFGILWSLCSSADISQMIQAKESEGFWESIFRSFGCGVCMFLAVDMWGKMKNPLCIILPVMLFIMAGFDHCIANTGYLGFARTIDWRILTWILGNSLGSWTTMILCNLGKENPR